MTVRVFPVRLSGEAVPTERNARGHRCPKRVTYTDTHHAPRARGTAVHEAQDIFAPSGAHVLAPESGVVVGSSASEGPTPKGGHWLRLEVQRSDGAALRTYYLAHLLDVPHVRTGDRVEAGQLIAKLGRTGNAERTCPHLHIGARRYRRGRAINLFAELRAVDPTTPAAAPSGPLPEAVRPAAPVAADEDVTVPEVWGRFCSYSEALCSPQPWCAEELGR